jgi:hypothetical protein
MRLRAPTPAERLIIKAFLEELEEARQYNAEPEKPAARGRNMIYALTAKRCGVEYNRVVELCHDKLYVEKSENVWFHGWKTGEI